MNYLIAQIKNLWNVPANGEYVTTDIGLAKVLDRNDPLKLGRVLVSHNSNRLWAYPYFI